MTVERAYRVQLHRLITSNENIRDVEVGLTYKLPEEGETFLLFCDADHAALSVRYVRTTAARTVQRLGEQGKRENGQLIEIIHFYTQNTFYRLEVELPLPKEI